MSAAPVRVALADDQALVRAGLRALLQGLGVQVVLEADDGQTLLDGLAHQPVDVVLSDIRMPAWTASRPCSRCVHAATPRRGCC